MLRLLTLNVPPHQVGCTNLHHKAHLSLTCLPWKARDYMETSQQKKVTAPAFLLTNSVSKGRCEEAEAGEQEHVEISYSYNGIK